MRIDVFATACVQCGECAFESALYPSQEDQQRLITKVKASERAHQKASISTFQPCLVFNGDDNNNASTEVYTSTEVRDLFGVLCALLHATYEIT